MRVPRYLMCRPSFFGVSYVINPWMQGHIGAVSTSEAERQWNELHRIFTQEIGVEVELLAPAPGLPDMVFTANAGLLHEDIFIPSRFRFAERQGEEIHFIDWFRNRGYRILDIEGHQEGAGDMLMWESPSGEKTLVCASGFRSDPETAERIRAIVAGNVISVNLVDPSFYHLDTCFCPLPSGHLFWYPSAFDVLSQARIRELVPAELRFEVAAEDAKLFSCNAVGLENGVQNHVVLGHVGADCRHWLELRGFTVHETKLTEFLKAGGSAKCLTLRIDSYEGTLSQHSVA